MNRPKVVAALTQAIVERGARPRSLTLDNELNASEKLPQKRKRALGQAKEARLTTGASKQRLSRSGLPRRGTLLTIMNTRSALGRAVFTAPKTA